MEGRENKFTVLSGLQLLATCYIVCSAFFYFHFMVVLLLAFMNYILTDHAQKRIAKRQIRAQWI